MLDRLLVRAVLAADLDAVVAIERASFSDPWSRSLFAESLASRRMRFELAATPEGVVAGYVVSAFVADEGEIMNLAVAPAFRRAGAGGLLLARVITAARTAGVVTLHLEVRESNGAARALYARAGFREAGRRPAYYRRPLEDALILRLTVAEAPA